METYKLFTKNPIEKIEEIILRKAIPFALKKIANDLSRNNLYIQQRQELLHALPLLVFNGLQIMRGKGQENKQIYELFHGCILTAFLNGIEPDFEHDLFYPEDESYDFLVMKYPRGKKPDFKPLPNKEISKNADVFKIELAELTKPENLEKIITDKSKYKKRILLISIAFNGQINFQEIFNKSSEVNKSNFETIWLMGQVSHPKGKNKLYYFIAEMAKYKEIFPLFELLINWSKIQNEVNKAFSK